MRLNTYISWFHVFCIAAVLCLCLLLGAQAVWQVGLLIAACFLGALAIGVWVCLLFWIFSEESGGNKC